MKLARYFGQTKYNNIAESSETERVSGNRSFTEAHSECKQPHAKIQICKPNTCEFQNSCDYILYVI